MRLRSQHLLRIVVSGIVTAGVAACGDDDQQTAERATSVPPAAEPTVDPPVIEPSTFVDVIDNPYLPMPDGAHWRYEGEADGELEVTDVTVTGERKLIMGISAHVVHDTVTVGGELVEDTFDWFAQDGDGNVWYLGEDSKDYEDGRVVSTEGSWEAGVDGAQPGIVMPAAPVAGEAFRQEFYPGHAEDMMRIVEIDGSASVAAGSFDDVVTTEEWNPLEPGTIERKTYAPGVGMIGEEAVAGGDDVAALVDYALG